jgi:predicted nucleic acid-binding protein
MRVLVDTSVWSLALRKKGPADHPTVEKLTSLLDGNQQVVTCGIILQEILQAFRSESTFKKIERHFEPVPLLSMERHDYILAARIKRSCADKGITASTVDCQIAAAAIGHDCHLLTADNDFKRISKVSKLKLI